MSYKFSYKQHSVWKDLVNLSEETVYFYNIQETVLSGVKTVAPNSTLSLVSNNYSLLSTVVATKEFSDVKANTYNGEKFLCFIFTINSNYLSYPSSYRLYYLSPKEELTMVVLNDMDNYEFECIPFPTSAPPLAYPRRLN